MVVGCLESVQEEDTFCSEDLRRSLVHLRQQYRAQGRVLVAWKTRLRQEKRAAKERDDQLKAFQSDLVVLESQVKRSRSEFQAVIKHKDEVIDSQQSLICNLSIALAKRGGQDELKQILPAVQIHKPPMNPNKQPQYIHKSDTESSNDADSAIMMEDTYDSMVAVPCVKGDVKVMRSISDALEVASRSKTSPPIRQINRSTSSSEEEDCRAVFTVQKEASGQISPSSSISPSITPLVSRRNVSPTCFLYDSDETLSDGLSDNENPSCSDKSLLGSYEKLNSLAIHPSPGSQRESIHIVYNRVMSNHRNVTKPKDVKYKRINKAKSRSLEELRGKLKFWDPTQTICMDMGQSEV